MSQRHDFTTVLQRLILWREAALAQLRDPSVHAEALALKLELDAAIAALEFCEHYQIKPNAPVTVLPNLKTQSPSSAYRVAEDHESDNQANWVELEINDWHLELYVVERTPKRYALNEEAKRPCDCRIFQQR